MKLLKTGVVLLPLFLAAIVMVPGVSTGIVNTIPQQASDQFMEWAYSMNGKEVTPASAWRKGFWDIGQISRMDRKPHMLK